jgi:hypothetical protein
MTEEVKDDLNQNIVAEPHTETMVEDQGNLEQEGTESQKQEKQTSDKEENLRRLREKYEKEKREKEELLKYYQYQQYQSQIQHQSQKVQEPEEEYDPDETPTRGQVKKEFEKLRKEMEGYKQEIAYQNQQTSLRQKYPDYDLVVTTENVELLRESFPEIAAALHRSQDSYNTAASAYTLIKRLGIVKGHDPYQDQKESIDQNLKKPRPSASMNPTNENALSRAAAYQGKLTPDLKKKAYEEMMNIIRNKP